MVQPKKIASKVIESDLRSILVAMVERVNGKVWPICENELIVLFLFRGDTDLVESWLFSFSCFTIPAEAEFPRND